MKQSDFISLFSLKNPYYFNNASSGPLCSKSEPIINQVINYIKEPDQDLMMNMLSLYENSTVKLADTLNYKKELIGMCPSPSYVLTTICNSLDFNKNDEILVPDVEYSSNIMALKYLEQKREVKLIIEPSNDSVIDYDSFISKINENTKMVVVSWVQFLSGQIAPLQKIAKKCEYTNSLFIIDATQGLGLLPIDLSELSFDAFYSSTHKWCCSMFGSCVTAFSKKLHDLLKPLVHGALSYENTFGGRAPQKLEVKNDMSKYFYGTPESLPYICAAENLFEFKKVGQSNIHNWAMTNRARIEEILIDKGFNILAEKLEDQELAPIISFSSKDNEAISEKLKKNNVIHSVREKYIRLATHGFIKESSVCELDNFI